MRLPVAALLCLAAAPALAAGDPRQGRWPCTFAGTAFGTLSLSGGGYALSGAPQFAGTGRLTWDGDAFSLVDGPLTEGGVTGGMVYQPPGQPDLWVVDLYSDLGVVLECRPRA